MKDLALSMGWVKDYPDIRDFSPETVTDSVATTTTSSVPNAKKTDKKKAAGPKTSNYVEETEAENVPSERNEKAASLKLMLDNLGLGEQAKGDGNQRMKSAAVAAPPVAVDLRPWCSPIENQGNIGSCTANAAVGVLEYYEKRAFGKHLEGSRLFTYKTTRTLLGWTGDTGAYLRSTMASMAMFGVSLEKYWPYDVSKYDIEPSSFVYAIAQNYKALTYYRLDPQGTPFPSVLTAIKTQLQAGLPSMFGFTCYSSLYDAVNGKIPFPKANEQVVGGHAIVAVGYDDNIIIGSYKGALLIRNSWGTGWGMGGYGYLPYEYVLKGIAVDFWVLIKNDWVDTGKFGL